MDQLIVTYKSFYTHLLLLLQMFTNLLTPN